MTRSKTAQLALVCTLICELFGSVPGFAGGSDGDDPPVSTAVSSGSYFDEGAAIAYLEAVHASNGDLDKGGVLLRGFGAFGGYSYGVADEGTDAEYGVDVDYRQLVLGVGYQVLIGEIELAAFASGVYEEADQSPEDPDSSVRGTEWGFEGRIEVETTNESPLYANGVFSYNTAFKSYSATGRLGASLGQSVIAGLEFGAEGDEDFDQVSYGAFLSGLPAPWSLIGFGGSEMEISAGWADTRGSDGGGQGGGDSAFVNIDTTFWF